MVTFGCLLIAIYHMDVTIAPQFPSFLDLHGNASSDVDADADDDDGGDGGDDESSSAAVPATWSQLWQHSTEVSPYFEGRLDTDNTGTPLKWFPTFSDLHGNAMGDVDTPLHELAPGTHATNKTGSWWTDQTHDGC